MVFVQSMIGILMAVIELLFQIVTAEDAVHRVS